MIKGILLEKKPGMADIAESDVLSKFDPLNKYEDRFDVTFGPDKELSATRRVFYSDSLYITTYTSQHKDVIDTLMEVYNILNRCVPEFIKAFKKGDNAIFVAWPRYEDKFEDATYTLMIEELTRIAAFFMKEFGVDDEVCNYLKAYVNLCISWK